MTDPSDCAHERTVGDDDGLDAKWNECADCGIELRAERDEDGGIILVPADEPG